MANEWLDQKTLEIIDKPPNGSFNDPISIDSSDDESDQSVSRLYLQSKAKIQLPNTNQTEELQYIPPNLPLTSSDGNNSTEPHFISPPESFNIFEHYNYQWIPAPEFEKK